MKDNIKFKDELIAEIRTCLCIINFTLEDAESSRTHLSANGVKNIRDSTKRLQRIAEDLL